MQIMLKFRGIRKDGSEDLVIEIGVEVQNQQAKGQAKASILQSWTHLGGMVKDNPDGTTIVYPHALFKMIVVEESSIVLCQKAPS